MFEIWHFGLTPWALFSLWVPVSSGHRVAPESKVKCQPEVDHFDYISLATSPEH